jgi:cation/acetate symporter
MEYSSIKLWPILVLCLSLIASVAVGLSKRKYFRSGYGIDGHPTGHAGIGMAIASNWMSAASFLGIAGVFFVQGYFAFAYILGWTGGYVLLYIRQPILSRPASNHPAPASARRPSPLRSA